MKVILSDDKMTLIEKLWFIYGNRGPRSTPENHKFIQAIIETNEDWREFYNPTADCIDAVDSVLRS